MRFLVLLLLSAGGVAAHENKTIDLPVPVVEAIQAAADFRAALAWTGYEQAFESAGFEPNIRTSHEAWLASWEDFVPDGFFSRREWFVLHVANISAVLDDLQGIQEDGDWDRCYSSLEQGRFAVQIRTEFRGGNGEEFDEWSDGLLKRGSFPIAYALLFEEGMLRDAGLEVRFWFTLEDRKRCAGFHINHVGGDKHREKKHSEYSITSGPFTEWIPIADLLDGEVSVTPSDPDPEEPEVEVEEPAAPSDQSAELARLRAENAALRGDLSTVRDSVDALLEGVGGEIVTLYDTVLVSHTDTLLFCPPSDDDRRDLFDLFTGVEDDSTETEGAGKAAVRVESWGAIKALVGSDAD